MLKITINLEEASTAIAKSEGLHIVLTVPKREPYSKDMVQTPLCELRIESPGDFE